MARSYASIVTSIWRDTDFCARTAGAQRTYFMLVSQPEISAAGVLPLTISRWSLTVPPTERHLMPEWLNELAEHTYVCIDNDTQELLVRSFLKWDRGYGNIKRQPVIREAMSMVVSPSIREVLRSESDALNFDYQESLPQVNRVSDALSRNPGKGIPQNDDSDRVVVTKVGSYRNPQSAIRNPGAVDPEIADESRSRPVSIDARKLSRAYTDKVGMVDKAKVALVVKSAQFKYSDDQITEALDRLGDRPDLPLTIDVLRIEIETQGKPRGRPTESTGTTRSRAALDRAARYAAEDLKQIGAS